MQRTLYDRSRKRSTPSYIGSWRIQKSASRVAELEVDQGLVVDEEPSVHVRGGRLLPRRGRARVGRFTQQRAPVPDTVREDTFDVLGDDTVFDTMAETRPDTDLEMDSMQMEPMIAPPDLDYDSEGNPIVDRDEESSSDGY